MLKDFFRTLKSNLSADNLAVFTAVSDDYMGATAILSGDKLPYTSRDDINWDDVAKAYFAVQKTGLITVNGTDFFCEKLTETPELIICGAGHVSMPVIQIAKILKFHVTVIDDRITFTNNALEAGADKVICDDFNSALDSLEENPNRMFVVVTRGHRYDKDCLLKILDMPSRYVGLMSSKARLAILKRDLRDLGVDQSQIDYIHSPIGLNINSETPEEIAVSILSQIIQVKNENGSSFGFSDEFLCNIDKLGELEGALCTIIRRRGSAPREIGSKMIVAEDGTCYDTIGGGCVEAEIRGIALDVIASGKPVIAENNMTLAQAEEEGMVCGGIVEILIQPIN